MINFTRFSYAVIFGLGISTSAHAQTAPEQCFVFTNNYYSGSTLPRSNFFSMVSSEAQSSSCSFGQVVNGEGRFYVKNTETGQVNRLGGENISIGEAQSLAAQNGVSFYSCVQIVCSNNSVNTDPRAIEPKEIIIDRAKSAAANFTIKVMQNNLKDYFKMISYAHEVKNQLAYFTDTTVWRLATNSSHYQSGFSDGVAKCQQTCESMGETIGKNTAAYLASGKVDQLVNEAFKVSQRPNLDTITIPAQDDNLKSLTPYSSYDETISSRWNEADSIYSGRLRSASPCGSTSCSSSGGVSISTPSEISSIYSLKSSNSSLLDFSNQISGESMFSYFAQMSSYDHSDPAALEYYKKIQNDSVYQNTSENRSLFETHFKQESLNILTAYWAPEINKYNNHYPVQSDVASMADTVITSLGYAAGFNRGYARDFLAPGQVGYKKVFNSIYTSSFKDRVTYYNTNAIFTDIKVIVSNVRNSDEYTPYDQILVSLNGLSNKGFKDGEIECSITPRTEAITKSPSKKFKIPAYTRTQEKIVLGTLATIRGDKVSPLEASIPYSVVCSQQSEMYFSPKVTWTETLKDLATQTKPELKKALLGYVIHHLNKAYISDFNGFEYGQSNALSPLLTSLVTTYKALDPKGQAQLDAMKTEILTSAFGTEPEKKWFNKNINYKLHQRIKTHLVAIKWTEAPKK